MNWAIGLNNIGLVHLTSFVTSNTMFPVADKIPVFLGNESLEEYRKLEWSMVS